MSTLTSASSNTCMQRVSQTHLIWIALRLLVIFSSFSAAMSINGDGPLFMTSSGASHFRSAGET